MAVRNEYKTKQMSLLSDYFKSIPGTHFTVSDALAYLRSRGAQIGQATVYRRLEALVEKGEIRKYVIDSNSPACFEYTGTGQCVTEGTCFHCKCEKCGKLIHMSCEELGRIQAHLFDEHHFRLDPMRTVFYGLCENCG